MGCDIHPYAEVRRDGKWQRAPIQVPDDRNYWTFAVLADVRNGFGFAGCYTGEPVTPIAQPRGLPEDTSVSDNDAKYDSPEYVWLGDHSHSWLTLQELLAVDLDTPVIQGGIITRAQLRELHLEKKLPETWCGGKSPMTDDDVSTTWTRPLRECAWLLPKIIDALKPLGEPKDVRLVFGFDS
jgi:hypothetical protein